MKKLEIINGALAAKVVSGATIIWAKHDGYDWTVVVKNPPGSEWKFTEFATLQFHLGSGTFSKMCDYNHTKFQTLKKVNKDHFEAMFHKKNNSESAAKPDSFTSKL